MSRYGARWSCKSLSTLHSQVSLLIAKQSVVFAWQQGKVSLACLLLYLRLPSSIKLHLCKEGTLSGHCCQAKTCFQSMAGMWDNTQAWLLHQSSWAGQGGGVTVEILPSDRPPGLDQPVNPVRGASQNQCVSSTQIELCTHCLILLKSSM